MSVIKQQKQGIAGGRTGTRQRGTGTVGGRGVVGDLTYV